MNAKPAWDRFRQDLAALHAAALAAADPAAAVRRTLRREAGRLTAGDRSRSLGAGDRVRLVAFGKASPGMARAAIEILGDAIVGGDRPRHGFLWVIGAMQLDAGAYGLGATPLVLHEPVVPVHEDHALIGVLREADAHGLKRHAEKLCEVAE